MRGRQRLGSAAMAVVLSGSRCGGGGPERRRAGRASRGAARRPAACGRRGHAGPGRRHDGGPGGALRRFTIRWRNAFLKAQQGTFVPFTLLIDARGALRPIRRSCMSGPWRARRTRRPRPERSRRRPGPAAVRPKPRRRRAAHPARGDLPGRPWFAGQPRRASIAASQSPRVNTTCPWSSGSARRAGTRSHPCGRGSPSSRCSSPISGRGS